MLGAVRVGIEGIPVIIRFKTIFILIYCNTAIGIEGIPVIIRFKTNGWWYPPPLQDLGIEGIPLITRFKTFFWNKSIET